MVASIHTVRCEGTPQPLNTAYTVASSTPPTNATCGTGQASPARQPSRSLRRHSQPTAAAASQANMVTCKPEMLIKWAMPVARNRSQSARSMAFWSPTTSAAITPASCRSATCW